MKPQEAAARFAALTWYIECRQDPSETVRKEARRFARQNWAAFLPVAHEGLGRLLLRVAAGRRTSRRAAAV